MPDPLSITTGVVALLQITVAAGKELKKLHDGAAVVQETISGLTHDVDGLKRVLDSMRATFETITALHGTGHIASLWENVARSIEDGKTVLSQLVSVLQGIDEERSLLDAYRKQLRLDRAEERIRAFRVRIQSYRDSLQLCLSAILLWNQTSGQVKADQVLPNLSDLHNEVRRLARCLNDRIDDLQGMIRTSQNDTEVTVVSHLRDCVQSAASTISSATTIISARQSEEDDYDPDASDFGDCFPSHQNLTISRWMASGTISEYEEVAALGPVPESIADLSVVDHEQDVADSDDELEDEMTCSLLESAKQKSIKGDSKGAEKNLLYCLGRINAKDAISRHRLLLTHLEAVQRLYVIYYGRQQWDAAQQVLSQKLELLKQSKGQQGLEFLNDVLNLAHLMLKQNNITAAQLHARQALRGYRRLKSQDDAKNCLRLLIQLCEREENENDAHAYSVMLERLDSSTSEPHVINPLRSNPAVSRSERPTRRLPLFPNCSCSGTVHRPSCQYALGTHQQRTYLQTPRDMGLHSNSAQYRGQPRDLMHTLSSQEQYRAAVGADQNSTSSSDAMSLQASDTSAFESRTESRTSKSDDGSEKRKSGFSAFVNNLVGTPRRPVISAPENFVHVTHVGYDPETGDFTVRSSATVMKLPPFLFFASNAPLHVYG